MRVDKKSLFLSVAICLLPILIGVYYYDVLPEQIAVHFNVSGEPDNFVSRTRAIIELPIFFAIVQVIISLVVDFDKTPSGQRCRSGRAVGWSAYLRGWLRRRG